MAVPRNDTSLPIDVGPYRRLGELGRGGMGVVYLAEHRTQGTRVALKTVDRGTPRTLFAIRTEIAAAKTLQHPGLVRFYEDGLHDGVPWYSMELIEGETLAQFNARLWPSTGPRSDGTASTFIGTGSPLSTDSPLLNSSAGSIPDAKRPNASTPVGALLAALRIYRGLCDPLGYLHRRGMVHRDLKPGNVMIRRGAGPVIMDFGLLSFSRGAIGREVLAGGKRGLGTISYVSPEQLQGLLVDARADLYALGCMLYETVTGEPPFGRQRSERVRDGHLAVAPVPPRDVVSDLPPELNDLILGLLEKRPQDRIAHVDEVARTLTTILGDSPLRPGEDRPIADTVLFRPQLAGRQAALNEIMSLAQRMRDYGTGGLVILSGESGIGKTLLLSEFGRRAAQQLRVNVVEGECFPSLGEPSAGLQGTGGPLLPFRQLLQHVADRCRQEGPTVTRRLLGARAGILAVYESALGSFNSTESPVEVLPPQAARDRVLSALEETLKMVASESPLVLILDDLQWADDLSVAFLSSLGADFFLRTPVLIVGTLRVEEVPPGVREIVNRGNATTINLDRLDTGAVTRLVADMLATSDPPAALVEALAQVSEGNPFFVAEYLRLLASEGMVRREGGRWRVLDEALRARVSDGMSTPESLRNTLDRRLAALSPEARMMAEFGSVLGRDFDGALACALVAGEVDNAPAALKELCARQVLHEVSEGHYRFDHDKLREACYAATPIERRREMHRRAALAIEALLDEGSFPDGSVETLADHFRNAGDRAKALIYTEKAANEALATYANRRAAALFKSALELADADAMTIAPLRRARWCRMIGDALQGIGELKESETYFRLATQYLGWPAPKASMGSQLGATLAQVLRQVGHRLFPERFLSSGTADADSLLEAARAYDRLQQVLYYQGGAILPMFHACVTSLNLAELAPASVELVTAYTNAHAVAGIMPAHWLAETYLERARAIMKERTDTNADTYLGVIAAFRWAGLCEWQLVSEELDRCYAIAERIGFRRRAEEVIGIRGVAQFLSGDFSGALASATLQYQSSMRGDVQTQCWSRLGRAQVFLVQDRIGEAHPEIDQAVSLSSKIGKAEQLWAQVLLAQLHLANGDARKSRVAALTALDILATRPPVPVYCIHAYEVLVETLVQLWVLARQAGDPEGGHFGQKIRAARKALVMDSARVYRAATPGRWNVEAAIALAEGSAPRALRFARKARALSLRLKTPYQEARALRILAQAASPLDSELLDLARARFREMGATSDLRQLNDFMQVPA